MEDVIGTTAGKIYLLLETKGELTIAALKKELDVEDPNLIPMGLGWLSREGKVTMTKKGKNIAVALATAELSVS